MGSRALFAKWMVLIWGLTLTALSDNAFASSFQLQEQSASGLGVAYSGMAAATQDASTAFWNPAGMSFISGVEVSVAAQFIAPKFNFTSDGSPPAGSTYAAFGDGGNGGVSAVVPAFYLRTPITSSVSAGFAVNVPFGLSTEWNNSWAGMFYAVESKIQTVNINPVIAWKANDVLSFGAGISYQRLDATLTNALTPLIPAAQGRVDGNAWAWGWNVGVLADVGHGTRVGLTYRSGFDYRLTGALTFNSAASPLAAALPPPSSVAADVKLPDVASVAIAKQFDSGARVLADFTFTGWNSLQALTVVATSGPAAGNAISSLPLNNTNSWRAGVGVEYPLNPVWLLRAGTAYDRSPIQDQYREPRLPDSDRTWLALGGRVQLNERWTLDVGYAHLWLKDASSELPATGAVPGALFGTYTSNTNIVGVQTSVRF